MNGTDMEAVLPADPGQDQQEQPRVKQINLILHLPPGAQITITTTTQALGGPGPAHLGPIPDGAALAAALAETGRGRPQSDDPEDVAAALARLAGSRSAGRVQEVAGGLRELGFTLIVPSRHSTSDGRAAPRLIIGCRPGVRSGAAGHLLPSYVKFRRTEETGAALAALPGARDQGGYIAFSIAGSAAPALAAARLLAPARQQDGEDQVG